MWELDVRPRTRSIGSAGQILCVGALIGLAAGAVASTIGIIAGEPAIDAAIAFEAANQAADSGNYLPSMSRTAQRVGLVVGTILAALALAFLATIAVAAASRFFRVRAAGAVWATVAMWVCCVVLPFVAYPPNPPGTASAADVDQRTAAWVLCIAVGIFGVWVGFTIFRWFRKLPQVPARRRHLAGIVGFLAGLSIVIAGLIALPAPLAIPEGFPAEVLWDFRLASLGVQTSLWATLAIGLWWWLGGRAHAGD